MDETKLVFEKGETQITCHEDGLVEVSGKFLQLTHTDFEEIVQKRRDFMWRSRKRIK